MLRFSSKLINFTQTLTRHLTQNAPRHASIASVQIQSTIGVTSQLNATLENLQITTPPPVNYHQREIIDIPIISRIIENPRDSLLIEIRDIIRPDRNQQIIEDPSNKPPETNDGIQAARLIVIRRRKMKKHKLRKLRKKMKFEWAKVRQRREMRKEKRFQAGLLFRIKKAEAFSAEEYVSEKLRLANETPIPRFWKGKRLPQFIIKEKLGIK